jgi:hypothetical protein
MYNLTLIKININFIFRKHGEDTPLTRDLHYYESNATWTDEIRAKTKKLGAKQDEKDLLAINYRFQGELKRNPRHKKQCSWNW